MNVLLTSVGRRAYLVNYFKEALKGRGKVVATNTNAKTTGMIAADVAEIVPPAHDPAFIESLLNICRIHGITLLCSFHDWEAPYISVARQLFLKEGVFPVVPTKRIIDICLDKLKTDEFARENGIATPFTFQSLKEVDTAIEEGKVDFPFIIKPRFGQGSINLLKVVNRNELKLGYKLVSQQVNRRQLDRFIDDYNTNQVLIQECVSGDEYGVDIINNLEGEMAAVFIKKKFAMRSGETDGAETVNCPSIEQVAKKISRLTRHPGNLDADFFIDSFGNVLLLEMNPRFGGGYPFSHMGGADLPRALIAWAKREKPDPKLLQVRIGVRSLKEIKLVAF